MGGILSTGGGGGGGGGDYFLVVKFMGGILSTYTKMSRGVLSGGDYVRIPRILLHTEVSQDTESSQGF